jgi:type IV secretory pathway VirD2 relaxase
MKKADGRVVSLRTTADDSQTLDIIRDRLRATGEKRYATRADYLREALSIAQNVLSAR